MRQCLSSLTAGTPTLALLLPILLFVSTHRVNFYLKIRVHEIKYEPYLFLLQSWNTCSGTFSCHHQGGLAAWSFSGIIYLSFWPHMASCVNLHIDFISLENELNSFISFSLGGKVSLMVMRQKRKWDLKNISVYLTLQREKGPSLTHRAVLAYKTVLTKKDSLNYRA